MDAAKGLHRLIHLEVADQDLLAVAHREEESRERRDIGLLRERAGAGEIQPPHLRPILVTKRRARGLGMLLQIVRIERELRCLEHDIAHLPQLEGFV